MTTDIQDALKRIEEHSSRVVRGAEGQRKGRGGQDRYYTYTEQGAEHVLPSVTTVLQVLAKPALVPWARNVALEKVRAEMVAWSTASGGDMLTDADIDGIIESARKRPDEVRDQAADLGTRAHDFIAEGIRDPTRTMAIPDDILPVIDGFHDWLDQAQVNLELAEVMVANVSAGYAGTVDAIGYSPETGRLVVLDWKTGNGIYPEMALQAAAYASAVSHAAGQDADDIDVWVVRFARDKPEFEARQANRIAALDAFVAASSAWSLMQRKDNLWKEEK